MKQSTQLNTKQIQKLFDFAKSKHVRSIDLQYEIVDHLASGIERQISEDPQLSFEQALKIEYGKFPITGFSKFKEAKSKALQKYWRKKIWSCIATYFTIPKIILTAIAFMIALLSCKIFPSYVICITGLILNSLIRKRFRKEFDYENPEKNKYSFFTSMTFSLNATIGCTTMGFLTPFGLNALHPNVLTYTLHSLNPILPIMFGIMLTYQFIIVAALHSGEFKQLLIEEVNKKYKHLNINLDSV